MTNIKFQISNPRIDHLTHLRLRAVQVFVISHFPFVICHLSFVICHLSFATLAPARSAGVCHLILVLAWALRLYELNADSLWEDEIFTATQSPLPVGELLRWTAGDIHPPGYYLIVGRLAEWLGWSHLPPSALTDWLWRFLAVVVGALAVAVTYRLGSDLLGRRVGQVSAMLLAVSPVAVQYSQEARMHGLFLLGAALSTWTLGRALATCPSWLRHAGQGAAPTGAACPLARRPGRADGQSRGRPGRWRWWLAYALATALSLYTVYLAFVVLAAQAAWVVVIQMANGKWQMANGKWQMANGNSQFANWSLSIVLAFILYLPWWPTLLGIVDRRMASDDAGTGVGSPLVFLVKGVYSLGPGPGWVAWLFLGLWAVGLASLIPRRKLALALFAGLWLALPLVLPFVFRDPRALHVRNVFLLPVYLVFVAQGGLVLVAGGWWLISRFPDFPIPDSPWPAWRPVLADRPGSQDGLIPRLPFAVALIVLAFISALFLPGYYQHTKPDWRGVAAYLAARTMPGDVIVTGPLFDVGRYLDYYYAGPAELLPPAALVASLPDRVGSMRASGGRVWAVTRFQPAAVAAVRSVQFPGLTISEPVLPIYEPEVLTAGMIDLMQQAVDAAPTWAAEMSAGGVLDPDPKVARAAAYLFLGDVYRAAGRVHETVVAYEAMVSDHPASAGGYATLAEAYVEAGQPEAAVTAYQRAVALNPDWQGSLAEKAASLAEAGHWDEAAAAYREIIQ